MRGGKVAVRHVRRAWPRTGQENLRKNHEITRTIRERGNDVQKAPMERFEIDQCCGQGKGNLPRLGQGVARSRD